MQICSALIDSLIKCYLDDSASTDAISERLRDVCPNLFSSDDAVSTKVSILPSIYIFFPEKKLVKKE